MKFLCIITGESFRDGEGQTRGRGTGNSYSNQIKASMSQVNFLHFLEEKFNLKCEIFYNFYKFNDEWDDKLVSIYSNFLVNGSFNFFPIGEANLITQTIDLVKKNINIMNYTFILFFRVDHYLKNYFYTIFDLNKNQILFSFPSIPGIPTYSINEHDLLRDNKIWVDHQIMYVPQKFIYKLLQYKIWNRHESYSYAKSNEIDEKSLGFFVNTYHSSSSDMTWNPLYHQVGRVESKKFKDLRWYLNMKTRKPQFNENSNNYSNLSLNDFMDNLEQM